MSWPSGACLSVDAELSLAQLNTVVPNRWWGELRDASTRHVMAPAGCSGGCAWVRTDTVVTTLHPTYRNLT